MKINDIITETKITEAPVGMMKRAGQAIGAKALGAIGAKGKASNQVAKAAIASKQGVKAPAQAAPAQATPQAAAPKKVPVSSVYVKTKDSALKLNAKEKRRLIQQLEKSIKISPAKKPVV